MLNETDIFGQNQNEIEKENNRKIMIENIIAVCICFITVMFVLNFKYHFISYVISLVLVGLLLPLLMCIFLCLSLD